MTEEDRVRRAVALAERLVGLGLLERRTGGGEGSYAPTESGCREYARALAAYYIGAAGGDEIMKPGFKETPEAMGLRGEGLRRAMETAAAVQEAFQRRKMDPTSDDLQTAKTVALYTIVKMAGSIDQDEAHELAVVYLNALGENLTPQNIERWLTG